MRLISCAAEESVDRAMLHRQHLLLDRLDHRQIAVDDEIEDGVEDIVDAVHQQGGRRLELVAQRAVGARRDVADA